MVIYSSGEIKCEWGTVNILCAKYKIIPKYATDRPSGHQLQQWTG